MYRILSSKFHNYKIVWYDTLTSTNTKAYELAVKNEPEFTIVAADYQTEGRGQRQNKWESETGKNLMFSILLRPDFLLAENQFLLLKSLSLGVNDYIKHLGIKSHIKWPNDIYIDNNKVAGMLIEHSIIGGGISFSIIGIGVNLNQQTFSNNLPNATSISKKLKREIDIQDALNNIIVYINKRYSALKNKQIDIINNDYFDSLYRKDGFYQYETNGKIFKAQIVDILNTGEIQLKDENDRISNYAFKEVNFVI